MSVPQAIAPETRFYVNGKECFTDQHRISGLQIHQWIGIDLDLAADDTCIHLTDSQGRFIPSPASSKDLFVVTAEMKIIIDSIPF